MNDEEDEFEKLLQLLFVCVFLLSFIHTIVTWNIHHNSKHYKYAEYWSASVAY